MTRINIGIPPCDLTDQHLLAEFRELPCIPNRVKKHIKEGRYDLLENIPEQFTLNEGHVRFFYDKLLYLDSRITDICNELQKRGFKLSLHHLHLFSFNSFVLLQDQFNKYYNNYTPTPNDIELIKSRIATRILNSKQQPRYYRQDIDKHEYIKNILKFQL